MNPDEILEDFLGDDDASKAIKKGIRTFQRMRREGKGPVTTYIGQTPWTSKAHLKEWVAAQARVPVRATVKPRARKRQSGGRRGR